MQGEGSSTDPEQHCLVKGKFTMQTGIRLDLPSMAVGRRTAGGHPNAAAGRYRQSTDTIDPTGSTCRKNNRKSLQSDKCIRKKRSAPPERACHNSREIP